MTPKFTQYFFLLLFLFTLFTTPKNLQAQAYTENFDNISLLTGNGWYIKNNSTPVGANTWFQGTAINATPDPGPFNAYAGAPNAYIGVNFASTSGSTGTISNWLLTPNRTLRNGDVFTFYTRKPTIGPGMTDYPDRLEVRMSTNGASTNVGSTAGALGDFTTLLLSINPTLVMGVYPQAWTLYTITISGLPAPTSGRIAFRYFVTNAGPTGTNSDYIGIDEVSYTPYVCPPFTLTASGALTGGIAGTAYSKTLTQTGALGAPNFAVTAGALPPGLTLSASGTISGTPTATGTFNFTATVNDASGCSGSGAYSITVVCPANPITFNAPALVCSNTPLLLEATPAGGTFSGTGVSGGIFDPAAGTQTITYDYTDPYGCAHNSSASFTVVDPGITTVTPVSQTICSGAAITTIQPANTIPGATFTWTRNNTGSVTGIDETGSGSISGSLTNTTTSPVIVTFTITSNVNGCIMPVTAAVTVNPSPAIVNPGNIILNNLVNTCSAQATYTAVATGTPTPSVSYAFSGATTGSGTGTGSGSVFNVGETIVILTATNSCGTNSISFTVTVNDNQAPAITCPGTVTVGCTDDIPAPDVSSVTATDNCSGVTVTFVADVISNQTCANRYLVTRTYRATDHAGNTTNCSQLITVDDQTAPVINCPANITATATGSCNAIVNFTVTATDCGGTASVITLPASGSSFPIGTTEVTATATDACGNESTCTFSVIVTDGQKPVFTSPVTDQVVCLQQDAAFTFTATNSGTIQWQQEQGNNWTDLNGANTSSYTVSNLTPEVSGSRYRVRLVGLCTTVYSDPVILTINEPAQPVITTAAKICIEDKNIQLLATPAGGVFSGPGVTDNKWNLEIPALGNHTINYTYTDANGCIAEASKVIELNFCQESSSIQVLQGYPNPTHNRTTLRALVTEEGTYNVGATNINGRVIWSKNIQLRRGWNLFDVDLTSAKAGYYIITLNLNGGRKGNIKLLKVG